MTSPRASTGTPPSANIVWDKSRLHHERVVRNGQALVPARTRPNSMGMVARRVNQQRMLAPQNGKPIPRSPESELTMSFDPMKDLHMWTMWRVAVNGRIVDETRKRTRPHTANSTPSGQATTDAEDNPYGRALVKTPLHRFIKVENGSQDIASVMMDPHREGGRHLGTQQFVFYGVPRVVLKKPKQAKQPPVRLP